MRVCICSMYQSNHYISVCLLFLFCLRVFIKRSYKNRSIRIVTLTDCMRYATSNFMKIPESCKYFFENILLINTEFLNFHFEFFFEELLNIRDPHEVINIPFCLFLDTLIWMKNNHLISMHFSLFAFQIKHSFFFLKCKFSLFFIAGSPGNRR